MIALATHEEHVAGAEPSDLDYAGVAQRMFRDSPVVTIEGSPKVVRVAGSGAYVQAWIFVLQAQVQR